VEFRFKTIQRHGVMMVSSPSRGRSDFFAVELSDGDLYVLFNLGAQTERFLVGRGVDDGREHRVRIDRNGRSLWLALDSDQRQDQLRAEDDGSLDLGSTLYVGGTASKGELPWPLYSRKRHLYRGCVWDLQLDGGDIVELKRLWQEQGMRGISAGCAAMPHDCSVVSCENGVCLESWNNERSSHGETLNGHWCDCAATFNTGTRCDRGQLVLTSVTTRGSSGLVVGRLVECQTSDHERGHPQAQLPYIPTPTQRAVPPGSVNDYHQKLVGVNGHTTRCTSPVSVVL